ncbi:MAG: T9SS type A sorting domain-containing protein [Sphingobacteriales bacterium]|nr:T9SS type A sorting domain-containing protein [Sphingobacteriales bacterium]
MTLPPFAVEQNAQLQIFDVTGKLVQNVSLNNGSTLTTLDVKDLPNGLYILSLSADGVRLAQAKMVVQH